MDKTVSACSMLAEVGAGTGDDDAHLVGFVTGEFGRIVAAGQFERAFGAAEAAFAVGDQRQQRRLAAHPACRPQFRDGLRPVTALIGGDADGFPHCGDPAGAGPGGPGMAECGLGVLVEQQSRRNEMTGDSIGGVLV